MSRYLKPDHSCLVPLLAKLDIKTWHLDELCGCQIMLYIYLQMQATHNVTRFIARTTQIRNRTQQEHKEGKTMDSHLTTAFLLCKTVKHSSAM